MNISSEGIRNLTFFRRYQTLSAFLIVICLAAYAMGANPFADETVAPFDRLLQFPGWATIPSSRTAVHTERSDILDSQLPAWITLKDQIRKGESPLWYPNGAGGQPISLELGNPAFLLFALIKDNALAYYIVGLVKLVVSGLGVYLLLRIFLGWLPSIWGGVIFMICGFNAAWFFWEQVTTSMWIPWLLWAAVMFLRTENRKWLPVITVVSLLLIFGGFPPVAAFGFYAFALLILSWNVHSFFRDKKSEANNTPDLSQFIKKNALPLLAVGISFFMAGVTLIPFRDGMTGINFGSRVGGTQFNGVKDLLLFGFYENPPEVERTAYIGIPVLFFSLIGIFSAFRTNNEKLKKFIFINLFLAIVTVLIAFGLLPNRLIRAIPVFGSNNWGRLTVVTLLSLSVLSSVGLDFIGEKLRTVLAGHPKMSPSTAGRIIAIVLIGVIVLQFYSEKRLFNSFNAVVPSEWFYPLTPSIKYVKEHLQPMQSVIADAHAYWFAGTLGAYGIPEWFAHSFRTDKEKEALGRLAYNRSKSPSTMVIDGKSIYFDSPLMDKFAIKYLLVGKDVGNARLLELPELTREQAAPLPSNSWRQHIYIPKDMIVGGIGFSFDTYGEGSAPSNLRLTMSKDNGEKNFVEAELPARSVTEREWSFFDFPNTLSLSKGSYYIKLSLPGYTGPKSLTAWATKAQGNTNSFLEINGVKTDLSLIWKIGYFDDMAKVSQKWNMIALENDIVVYENRLVTNSAYFVTDLGSANGQPDFSGLDVRQLSVDRIDIDNSHGDAGWIVLPMRNNTGWKAYVNDRQIRYDSYLDVLPAIPVSGPAHVAFKYEAESFRKGLMVSLAGVVVFLVFSWFCWRRRKKAK